MALTTASEQNTMMDLQQYNGLAGYDRNMKPLDVWQNTARNRRSDPGGSTYL